jgi:hypothetical protein
MSANRKTVVALVLLAITAAFSTASISTNYGNDPAKVSPVSFVGTYYTSRDEATIGGMTTFHSDGTVSGVTADMFSFADEQGNRRTTPLLGVWRKTGHHKIQVTSTFFMTEEFGDNYNPGGLVVRISYLAVFDKTVKGLARGYEVRNLVAEAFLPTQNPNTDTPVAVIELAGGGGFRIRAE